MIRTAFTIVELLVVITIIVVLLALLMPALDKAIYQAELVRCAAQMKSVAFGATLYTHDHKRHYMYRRAGEVNTYSHILKGAKAFIAIDADVDDRPIHDGYINLDHLIDPLCEFVDPKIKPLENPDETIYASYALYYGWAFNNRGRMQRLGDRWTARDAQNGVDVSFRWLLADSNIQNRGAAITASHPDRRDLLANHYAQAGKFDYGDNNPQFQIAGNAALPITYSWWRIADQQPRTTVDLNFAADDGGVMRLTNVANEHDDRTYHVPHQRNSGSGGVWLTMGRP